MKHEVIPETSYLPYNPPYTYSMAVVHTSKFNDDLLLVGLGNGHVLCLKQSDLQFYSSFELYGVPITHLLVAENQLNNKFILITTPTKE